MRVLCYFCQNEVVVRNFPQECDCGATYFICEKTDEECLQEKIGKTLNELFKLGYEIGVVYRMGEVRSERYIFIFRKNNSNEITATHSTEIV